MTRHDVIFSRVCMCAFCIERCDSLLEHLMALWIRWRRRKR